MSKRLLSLLVVSLAALCLIGCSGGVSQSEINESKENIAPYIDLLTEDLNNKGNVSLSQELYDNKDNFEFLGKSWQVNFMGSTNNKVAQVILQSHDFYSVEEHREFVGALAKYFGTEPIVERQQVGEHNTEVYYWLDDSVQYPVKFYISTRAGYEDQKDRFELYWDATEEMPN